ncbi:3-oxoacyl-ACP reductase [Paramagnetospirillum kuznetsovii]|uniref:3-oxoacyl-ACP reductase n=1 Tax=Paramagnetospirillum kuznetsovii TaxID=2053833 RepID=A0A364P2J6_9PROT|nr:3-oxoacyl-ACP reductase FabG [Paramagnetospirillum kuznetsovii]RAU23554.1 3-oxoacyl-ACP reductase [Paramagnetospirillum kuznetsovii]
MTTRILSPLTLVSGGSRGLGLGISEVLLGRGESVVAFSRRPSEDTDRLAKQYGGRFHFLTGDLADVPALQKLVKTVERDIGPITGLVNNAGMTFEQLLVLQPEEAIHRVLDVNLTGTLMLTREVTKHMMVRRFGRIVTISSVTGIRGYKGTAPYSAVKAGLLGMTRALARELGGRNITVNAVCPGYMETDMVHDMNPKQLKQIVRRTPLGRPGQVEDVSGVVAFLLSDDARFVSGQTLTVDGGLTC